MVVYFLELARYLDNLLLNALYAKGNRFYCIAGIADDMVHMRLGNAELIQYLGLVDSESGDNAGFDKGIERSVYSRWIGANLLRFAGKLCHGKRHCGERQYF